MPNPAGIVIDQAFDQLIRKRFFKGVRFDEPSGDPGWFGPHSPVWYVHEHTPAMILGLGAAAVIETLHPDFAWMGYDHSRAVERVAGRPTGGVDPEGLLVRGGHSFSFFMAVGHGPTPAADRVTRAVRGMHNKVRGVRPDGRAYDADDPETLRWAYATVVWGIATAHERYHPRPLTGADLDEYYRQFVKVGEALGGVDLPDTKVAVAEYLLDSVPLMGVTMPTVDLLTSLNSRSTPLPVRAVTGLAEWALLDLQPGWAKKLLRVPHYSPPTVIARRAAVWSGLNAARYGAGPLREVRQSRQRVNRKRAETTALHVA
ncbi:oxygenase MpaB family protein [Antrihabitans sp. YC2-6]|uniref:oxygenase MpaB family protein n=1 Tax=Antrihabitans sp. YC2-6 TaxID=2799498 RepID=UPI0018F3B0DA|nr:oxygenase MpaB family protein [Antrihabitans sp. YC2-6]MBJ8344733.1 DUF2236 domain-containing protein [Antrihabitans sp. YC2-6]